MLITRVLSTLDKVLTVATILLTLLINTHEPPSRELLNAFQVFPGARLAKGDGRCAGGRSRLPGSWTAKKGGLGFRVHMLFFFSDYALLALLGSGRRVVGALQANPLRPLRAEPLRLVPQPLNPELPWAGVSEIRGTY